MKCPARGIMTGKMSAYFAPFRLNRLHLEAQATAIARRALEVNGPEPVLQALTLGLAVVLLPDPVDPREGVVIPLFPSSHSDLLGRHDVDQRIAQTEVHRMGHPASLQVHEMLKVPRYDRVHAGDRVIRQAALWSGGP